MIMDSTAHYKAATFEVELGMFVSPPPESLHPLLPTHAHFFHNQHSTNNNSKMIIDSITHYKPATFDVELEEPMILRQEEEDMSNPVLQQVLSDLRDCQSEYGYRHGKVADAWNALGLIRVHMQRDAEAARQCHEHALRIYKENLQLTETAITLNDLGYCYEQLNQQDSALKLYREALQILTDGQLSDYHPCVISIHRAVSRIRRD
jgi:tetratricopeptide (TPR) repeat protein